THVPQEKAGGKEAERVNVQEVVESTFKGNHKTTRKAHEESTCSEIEKNDSKKMIEEILEQKKIVSPEEEQRSTKFL
ncbi:hypothetical protein J0J37_22805, partial [Vibrio vulnificus]|uniref:hypothetical protein n=1 Tax=Vibrio vulnificus TaxID=672 RepID=UPI0019D461D8